MPLQTQSIGTLSDWWAEILHIWHLNAPFRHILTTQSLVSKLNIMDGIWKRLLRILSELSEKESKKGSTLDVFLFPKDCPLSYRLSSESRLKSIKSARQTKTLSDKKCQPGQGANSKNCLNLSGNKCLWEMMITPWQYLKFKLKSF